FEWDPKKDKANKAKHGVSFSEAESVFADPNARLIHDPDHSKDEDRFIILGISAELRILVVCHCYREQDNLVRIISARKADKSERNSYGRYL
ncbi:MAG: BrnT family toxin, partial [Bdellovibrionales bacterium]|nr:BrnT family toxin [Bdellovibrionales bacterium]